MRPLRLRSCLLASISCAPPEANCALPQALSRRAMLLRPLESSSPSRTPPPRPRDSVPREAKTMAPNLFSRLVPAAENRSFYEQLRDDDHEDVEHRAGLALDEENLTHQFHEDDLDNAQGLAIDDSRISSGSAAPRAAPRARLPPAGAPKKGRRPDAASKWLAAEEEGDNEVPASLLVEPHEAPASAGASRPGDTPRPPPYAVPGPSDRKARAQWEAAQAQQQLHRDHALEPMLLPGFPARRGGFAGGPKERAMFRWANVSNVDKFIKDVYEYYQGAGLWCILLERLLHLL